VPNASHELGVQDVALIGVPPRFLPLVEQR